MKHIILFLLTSVSFVASGQKLKELQPKLGLVIDKSMEGEIQFIKLADTCEEFWRAHDNFDEENLTEAERSIFAKCQIEVEDYWSVEGPGCSWYCGGGQDTNSASSYLASGKSLKYEPGNIHDLSYKTAWVEGVPGHGIGEYIVYHFPPNNPRITDITIVNGYVKSLQLWKANSRVKKLKMYIDDKPFAILGLEDSRTEQTFSFSPIGYGDRNDVAKLMAKPWWTLKFEILEVYPGDKYDDTAITELYFDGIDVH